MFLVPRAFWLARINYIFKKLFLNNFFFLLKFNQIIPYIEINNNNLLRTQSLRGEHLLVGGDAARTRNKYKCAGDNKFIDIRQKDLKMYGDFFSNSINMSKNTYIQFRKYTHTNIFEYA